MNSGKDKQIIDNTKFDEFFAPIYGSRWQDLKLSLSKPSQKVRLDNPFPEISNTYEIDAGSIYPVLALDAQAHEVFADFCASPGGKLLAAVFALSGEGHWFANDMSKPRVAHLRGVLAGHLPEGIRERVLTSASDASRWGLNRKEHFHRILVDAPCSGERHLIASPTELQRWSKKGSQRLVIRQNSLLCSAIDSCKVGGRVVYSTCSISPLENDQVIERLKRSRDGRFEVVSLDGRGWPGEKTENGWIFLPDRCGFGPIYVCALNKIF